jgi:hypothetical protein
VTGVVGSTPQGTRGHDPSGQKGGQNVKIQNYPAKSRRIKPYNFSYLVILRSSYKAVAFFNAYLPYKKRSIIDQNIGILSPE